MKQVRVSGSSVSFILRGSSDARLLHIPSLLTSLAVSSSLS